MTLVQLEYLVAIDTYRHFVKAAESCHVTQATLSMMVKKLEEELGLVLFDRSRQPVVPTQAGEVIISQAKKVLAESRLLEELAREQKAELAGELRLGIIPTLAPYLLHRMVQPFMNAYPKVRLKITEAVTDVLVQKIKEGSLDAAVLVTPLHQQSITERVLFREPFYVYVSPQEKIDSKKFILPSEIDINKLWLLEEGHCLRSQVLNLCELKRRQEPFAGIVYEAGSIETLKKIVEDGFGMTILPALAKDELTPTQQHLVRHFKDPIPSREVSLVSYRNMVKRKMLDALAEQIKQVVPKELIHSPVALTTVPLS